MTDLRQAAQQALEALIDASNVLSAPMFPDAVAALRTALEQSEPPPEWEGINNIIAEYGLQAIDFVADWKATLGQAEPVCPECKAKVLYECVACSSNNYPPQQQAEPVAQRPWVGLTPEQIWKCNQTINYEKGEVVDGVHICLEHQNVVDFARSIEREIGFAKAELWIKRINDAVLAEREACAQVCEAQDEYGWQQYADAIRARGTT